jgi:hypothetical protein
MLDQGKKALFVRRTPAPKGNNSVLLYCKYADKILYITDTDVILNIH